MNDLILLTNELIPVYKNQEGSKLVNARELHEWLGVGTKFIDWIESRIKQYSFTENVDYTSFSENTEKPLGGRPSKEYIITLDMAKELSMVERTDKGKEARQYFIQCEEKLKETIADISQLSLETQLILKLSQSLATQELEQKKITAALNQTQEEIQNIREAIIVVPENWRDYCVNTLRKIAYNNDKEYNTIITQSYEALEQRAGCDLERRLKGRKERASQLGAAKSRIEKFNYLDCIEDDKKLIQIYMTIVKEMSIKYKVA